MLGNVNVCTLGIGLGGIKGGGGWFVRVGLEGGKGVRNLLPKLQQGCSLTRFTSRTWRVGPCTA
jgi:hypothetical protein